MVPTGLRQPEYRKRFRGQRGVRRDRPRAWFLALHRRPIGSQGRPRGARDGRLDRVDHRRRGPVGERRFRSSERPKVLPDQLRDGHSTPVRLAQQALPHGGLDREATPVARGGLICRHGVFDVDANGRARRRLEFLEEDVLDKRAHPHVGALRFGPEHSVPLVREIRSAVPRPRTSRSPDSSAMTGKPSSRSVRVLALIPDRPMSQPMRIVALPSDSGRRSPCTRPPQIRREVSALPGANFR